MLRASAGYVLFMGRGPGRFGGLCRNISKVTHSWTALRPRIPKKAVPVQLW